MSAIAFLPLSMSQMTLSAAVSSSIGTFFSSVFANPGQHFYAVIILGVLVVGSCAGLAFLVKKAYDKYCPDRSGG